MLSHKGTSWSRAKWSRREGWWAGAGGGAGDPWERAGGPKWRWEMCWENRPVFTFFRADTGCKALSFRRDLENRKVWTKGRGADTGQALRVVDRLSALGSGVHLAPPEALLPGLNPLLVAHPPPAPELLVPRSCSQCTWRVEFKTKQKLSIYSF